jgi:hypothetical protein
MFFSVSFGPVREDHLLRIQRRSFPGGALVPEVPEVHHGAELPRVPGGHSGAKLHRLRRASHYSIASMIGPKSKIVHHSPHYNATNGILRENSLRMTLGLIIEATL